jgi:5-oxopent-3-ene-1,2,5-tricarboxylate decarboxylase / 2-hydroxyhepta-2,4-diene-1,7-dioate isomerase
MTAAHPPGHVAASQHPLGLAPTKIIAVHLNYPSRAGQRGRVPEFPSYFLKPPSSLSWSGQRIVRPREAQLLAFEGEAAVVIGRRALRLAEDEALGCVSGYTAANDVGLYDLRDCDRGSNLRAKGQDGYTPVGPVLIPAGQVDPAALLLRTWVNGELRQEDSTATLFFPFARLIADLSRLMTLEPGDIILTGTPAGAGLLEPGDVVEVELLSGSSTTGRLVNHAVEAGHALAPIGAMPAPTPALRAAAAGTPPPPDRLDPAIAKTLSTVSTATISSQLRKRGIDNAFIENVRPARPDLRMVGVAATLRYLPLREDVFAERGGGMNAQKRAVEAIRPGQVLVIDCRGDHGAGTIGDILALRAARRGAAGIVTDGCLRDSPSFASLDLPVYSGGAHAAVLGRRHVPMDTGLPVSCGNVLVMPGDVLVGDGEGVIVIPRALAAEVAAAAAEQESEESFIYERVGAGESIDGLYPLAPARRPEYDAWRARQPADKIDGGSR